ncbi:hypothetical protein C0991_010564, partial [Blastosporella zonata]
VMGTQATLDYLVNHLFLPAKLPQRDDASIENDLAICDFVIRTAQVFESTLSTNTFLWGPIIRMLVNLLPVYSTGSLDKKDLQKLIAQLTQGETLIIPVRAQNACVFARRLEASTIYESFEVDPPNEQIMAPTGRLVRQFPGPAFEIADSPNASAFQHEIAAFLADMDVVDVGSAAITRKAGSNVFEVRDTADPHYITQLLTSIIHGCPDSKPADVERVVKRVRNEILWDRAYAPWRRSPLWLIIRVALQTTLRRGDNEGQKEYKSFMVFLLADIVLSGNDCTAFATDVLVCIQNKIVRRLRKLPDAASPALIHKVTEALRKAREVIEARWDEIRSRQALSPPWSPEELDITQDTTISLLSSKEYLSSRLQHSVSPLLQGSFKPTEARRISIEDLLRPEALSNALSLDPFITLADIEEFAAKPLDAWVEKHRSNSSACVALGTSIIIYAKSARSQYKDNPEDQSLMLLTVLLLWSALDRLAISEHPSLADYSPEIPERILDPILLRKSNDIEALLCLRKYIHTRHTHARHNSVFSDRLSSSSFAIRHFRDSSSLQRLQKDIEARAESQRIAKRKEFADLKAKYTNLVAQASSMDHHHQYGRSCKKCSLMGKAKNLSISVHEWPLPQGEYAAQATVFELRCPPAFQSWRTTTYMVLFDFCRPNLSISGKKPKAEVQLAHIHSGLKDYCQHQTRITFASPTKTFIKAHYSSQKVANVASDLSSILVNNGARYNLFDTECKRWAKDSFSDCSVEELCRFILPPTSPYYHLQYAMDRTTYSANQPLADQATVSPALGLHEYLVFGTLRSGPILQWFNILRELRARTLSFDRFEVNMLLTQAALQTGDVVEDELQWHTILKAPDFCLSLFSEIEDLLSTIESNWHHISTMQSLIILATRLLASCVRHDHIVARACSVLRMARTITFSWVVHLTRDLTNAPDDAMSILMRQRLCLAAATCRATYDVDSCYFGQLIDSCEDIRYFVQCAIHVQDNGHLGNLTTEMKLVLARDRRLSRNLAPTLWARIMTCRAGLDSSVLAIWADYQPGSDWKQLAKPNERWLTSTMSTVSASTIHYNLLDGTLFIDGKPIGRLPSSIVRHPTYVRLLGNKIFEVVPSTLPAMHFATRNAVVAQNFFPQLHFQIPRPDGGLIIQATLGPEILELVPHTAFDQQKSGRDFPSSVIEKYAHWLRVVPTSKIGHLTFHPLASIWKPSKDNWLLSFTPGICGGTMKTEGSIMVDVRSKTFDMVSKRLAPLEVPSHIHAMVDTRGTLSIQLPRFKMVFFLNERKELECSTIRDMVVDLNQSSGTMFGLTNQLVLRSKSLRTTRISAPGSRRVIIPFGKIDVQNGPYYHHSRVQISLNPGAQKYFTYEIDTTLERLTGTTMLSDIYKTYLHACTSFPLPDDLTGRTGTDEALCELESAKFLSFQDLTSEEVALLLDIAKLTPNIEWYPKHLRAMQTICWTSLGPLAQHWAFSSRVDSILRFWKQLSLMNGGSLADDLYTLTDSHFLARLDSRTSGLYVPREKHLFTPSDVIYPCKVSRRCGKTSEANLIVANVSAFVHDLSSPLNTVSCLWERFKDLRVLKNEANKTDSYCMFLSPRLTDLFLPLYEFFRQPSAASISKMSFALSTMMYTADSSDRIEFLIPTFLSFARSEEFRHIDLPLPKQCDYDLDFGVDPDRKTLVNLLHTHALQPPESLGPTKHAGESDHRYSIRREAYWKPIRCLQETKLVDMLVAQWPCEEPSFPRVQARFNLLDLGSSGLKEEICRLFLRWFSNINLRAFVDRVQVVLDAVRASLSTPVPATMCPYHIPSLTSVGLDCLRLLPVTLEDLLHRINLYAVRRRSISRFSTPTHFLATKCDDSSAAPVQISKCSKLVSLVEQFKQRPLPLHRDYGSALESSLRSHIRRIETNSSRDRGQSPNSTLTLTNDYELRRYEFHEMYQSIRMALLPYTSLELAMLQAGQWPILTVRALLNLLSNLKSGVTIPNAKTRATQWETVVITLAQMLMQVQRSRRALHFKILGREEDVTRELENVEYVTDVSFTDPEWLLIQIDSNFTVRPVQSRVAQDMIYPSSEQNQLTQLNMGEGKSAVIVPLVASALANGTNLVRVVTLKPLVNQTFDLLVRRLSGLTRHRVFYLPFSRDVKPELGYLNQLQQLYETCIGERGILVILPEHILSFRLMGIDLATGGRVEAAETLLASYRWLSSMSRDILDESDEILRATYQLVYTSGIQEPMDSHPDRWIIVQALIGYAQKHADILSSVYPNGLEVQRVGEYGCPMIRILDVEAGEALIDSVISDVLSSEWFKILPSRISLAASDFVRCRNDSAPALNSLRTFLHGTAMWKHLLLYRGLLGRGLLRFVLQEKRWRVDYGLDLTRTLLAVPYRAKDLPSLRADFGHPDVALALTCLSYYYGGLVEEQLDMCFELLFKLDDPPCAYDQWVYGHSEIPLPLRDIKGVNLDDHHQRKFILGPIFRTNKAVIDFYLSNVVFPRYAKQFPKKLSASSWDLAEKKMQIITGFSGTNDNRYLLPTSIQQHDMTAEGEHDRFGQLATNATVLSILLQPENDSYCCLQGSDGNSPNGTDFLDLLVKQVPPVRVLLDVGAQMLDMQSTELVSRWLSLVPEIDAIIFFNEADELVVMPRDGHIEKFISSQYSQKLDLCAVYLDDAHTRGTDLKLPKDFRAVVTMGPKLTKDRLVQGKSHLIDTVALIVHILIQAACECAN